MSALEPLNMWVIYQPVTAIPVAGGAGVIHKRQTEAPAIARRWEVREIETATDDTIEGTLPDLRARFESMGLYNLGRSPSDDPIIVEAWI